MTAWIARRMGCRVTEVLAEPAWAVEAWLEADALEAALAEQEEQSRAR